VGCWVQHQEWHHLSCACTFVIACPVKHNIVCTWHKVHYYLARTVHELAFHDENCGNINGNSCCHKTWRKYLKFQIFWDVRLCHSASSYQHSEGLWCHQNVGSYTAAQHNILEDLSLQQHWCENPKSRELRCLTLDILFCFVKFGNETIKILVKCQFLLFDSSQQVQQPMHNLVIISICTKCYGKCNMTGCCCNVP
jgi:hypothetical protein